jgi:hypothetical protein
MRKLRVYEITVETFVVGVDKSAKQGTVVGHQSGYNTCICPVSLTCDYTPDSKENHTCWAGCAPTGGPEGVCVTNSGPFCLNPA